ncbi:MAG: hypothetical protein KatS3mg093_401 [Candidatus Parcubacteria bacterium]|nr:MAG: hypothetical protein KatS3mg093_401 [Candidatus Parcubacteria bacterium]GIW67095.1 MAG: hypothetical protein KatS3mg095_0993 [Candidatus Parcubacteria bacterium]
MEGDNIIKNKTIRERIKPIILDPGFLLTYSNLRTFKNIFNYIKNENLKILDLGCGYKPFKQFFSSSSEYIGIDFGAESAEPDIVLDLNIQKLPFFNDYFDIVIISETLEHLYNIHFVIREAVRVVKKGGLIFISTPFIFPEHGHPFDFFRYTAYFYDQIAKEYGLKIITLRKATTIIGSWFFLTNIVIFYLISKIPLMKIVFYPVFVINNILGFIGDKVMITLGNKIDIFKRSSVLYAGISVIFQK